MSRLWERGEPLDELVLQYTAGEDAALDDRLVPYDILASKAHASMLAATGYLTEADAALLQKSLTQIGDEHARGLWHVRTEEEDCHTAIESRLVELAGEAGKRIHLGRSRNDQVLVALRLWLKNELELLARRADTVAQALDAISARDGDAVLPGYTHLQRAMPTTLALWAGGHAAELRDDAQGLREATRRSDRNPLGSAAGYGVPVLRLDREHTTHLLGFAKTHTPVTAVQLSRGKAEATALFEATLLAQDLGRLAAELCLFATAEFGFVRLSSEITTGSSMLPQKRNPDLFELARGRSAEALGCLLEVLTITTKLTSGYHRDLQLIKKPLMRGMDSVTSTASVMAHALPRIEFDRERMRAAIDPSMHRTAQAYELVENEGIPFREAYKRARGS